jgi:chromate transporter
MTTEALPGMADNAKPSFGEALGVWFKIGCLGFGGPAGQIALMHRIVIDEKKWVDEPRFLHALNFCMLLPGPEAQQLATYIGWLLHGVRGGLAAGILFVLPGAVVMLALSLIYALAQGVPLIEGALFGIKAAVLVIVVEALIRIGKRALKTRFLMALAAAAFVGIFFFSIPFPLIVAGAGLIGYVVARQAPEQLALAAETPAPSATTPRRWPRAVATAIGGLAVWWAPVALAFLAFGGEHVLVAIGLFFSKLAVVTFGGAYALLAYMAQQVVENYGWLAPGEMIDGLGLAETTPGPLILVTQFVGFLAAFRDASPFSPVTAGILGAAMTTWVTFVPSMVWIFVGGPYVEDLRRNRRLTGALAAITAAVVGVILNLCVWFTLHVLFSRIVEKSSGPLRWFAIDVTSLDFAAAALAVIAAALVFRLHFGLIQTIGAMAALGIAVRFAMGS